MKSTLSQRRCSSSIQAHLGRYRRVREPEQELEDEAGGEKREVERRARAVANEASAAVGAAFGMDLGDAQPRAAAASLSAGALAGARLALGYRSAGAPLSWAPSGTRSTRRALLLLVALLPPLVFLAAEAYLFDGDWQFPLDDSWIHLTFRAQSSRRVRAWHSTRGNRSPTTAPLWTALLGLLGRASWRAPPVGEARRHRGAGGERAAGLHRGAAARTFPPRAAVARRWSRRAMLVWSALSGMEVNLFVLLMLGGLRATCGNARRRPAVSCRRSPSCSSVWRR